MDPYNSSRNPLVGSASLGYHSGVTVKYMVINQIGLLGKFGINSNVTDVGSTPFIIYQFMGGFTFLIKPDYHRWNVNFDLLLGVLTMNNQANYAYYNNDIYPYYQTTTPGQGTGAGVCLSIGTSYRVGKRVYLILNAGDLMASIDFLNTIVVTHQGNWMNNNYIVSTSTIQTTMPIGMFFSNFGVSMHF
ncbi:MAG: hypothetical protein ACHQRM_15085 [Bacteroidia bacterium]